MTYFQRITAIEQACMDNNIPYSVNRLLDGWQIQFPWCKGDVACHGGTYGHDIDMVESYEFPWDEGDVSMLTVEEAIEKIITFYKKILDTAT